VKIILAAATVLRLMVMAADALIRRAGLIAATVGEKWLKVPRLLSADAVGIAGTSTIR
jgi:hypothetical protein